MSAPALPAPTAVDGHHRGDAALTSRLPACRRADAAGHAGLAGNDGLADVFWPPSLIFRLGGRSTSQQEVQKSESLLES